MLPFVLLPITMSHPFAYLTRITIDVAGEAINNILEPLRDDPKIDFI